MIMPSFSSVSSPGSGAPTTPFEEGRQARDGTRGTAEQQGTSRAERALLVKGKSPGLQQRRRRVDGVAIAESIIGADNRTRILETEFAPWRMICALRILSPFNTLVGTAWLVGARTLITAGHCVYDEFQMGGWASMIEVSPGRDGGEFPFGTIRATRFATVDRWINERNPDFDYAAIHLDEPLGEWVGWFATLALPAQDLLNYNVNVSGYPADRGNGQEQWFSSNRVLHVNERRLFYEVDTYGGQSGAPVWIYETDDGFPTVVGIHAYGVGGTPADLGITANSAPRITREVLAQFQSWVDSGVA